MSLLCGIVLRYSFKLKMIMYNIGTVIVGLINYFKSYSFQQGYCIAANELIAGAWT